MSTLLPINLDSLLLRRSVESERVEFKASWDPRTVGPQILKTICAFANDYHNLNGGYVVIGVAERDGRPVLTPIGLDPADVEGAQRWIRGNCNRLDPAYQPVLSPERVGERCILVVWASASDTKPHRAPDGQDGPLRFWVRLGSETVDAERRGSGLLPELMRQTARVPWDDRRAEGARIEDLSGTRVREYLRSTESGLLDVADTPDIYRRMRIVARVNEHEVPRNAGLLFFADEPERWFSGAKIEVVQFAAGQSGNILEERTFSGGLYDQVLGCLRHIENLSVNHVRKQASRPQVRGWVSYPLPAVREALVNAVYHRSYEPDQPEPTKVYLYSDRMEITSYPGPVPGIDRGHLQPGARVPAAPARNRRIGEFLKELRLAEGRLTGLPKVFRAMADNGSPLPCFDFDEARTWFRAVLPAHPEYTAISALRDAAHLRAVGEREEAFARVESAWRSHPSSAVLATEMIRLYAERGMLADAEAVFERFREAGPRPALPHVANTLADVLAEAGEHRKGREVLARTPPGMTTGQDAIDSAIVARRLKEPHTAHRYFERAKEMIRDDPRALLERVIQLDASPARHAWAWRELARTLRWLQAPAREVEDAYARAIELLPDEPRFRAERERFRADRRTRHRPRASGPGR